MRERIEIAIGSAVQGDEGFVGEVERIDLDPSGGFAAQVAVRPRHEGGATRLVPAALLEQGPDGLRLARTLQEFEELPADGPAR
ncbi:hypothetical protein [Catenulispora subtropica]|uniref:PRC-barrel domain-containing protein n=1 Tax=Catenulispora subtropica TaxID=450798 RepID=A0ABN2SI63_9ACTN